MGRHILFEFLCLMLVFSTTLVEMSSAYEAERRILRFDASRDRASDGREVVSRDAVEHDAETLVDIHVEFRRRLEKRHPVDASEQGTLALRDSALFDEICLVAEQQGARAGVDALKNKKKSNCIR